MRVALSAPEVEHMTLFAPSQEVMFLHQLLPTFGCPFIGPTATYEDSASCISLDTNDMTTSKSKLNDIRYHYIHGLVKLGAISIVWCPTEDMIADILTKFSLPSSIRLKHARRKLSSGT